jgi:hypothetical protein
MSAPRETETPAKAASKIDSMTLEFDDESYMMDTTEFSRCSVLMLPKASLVIIVNIEFDDISNKERPSPCAELRE